MDESGRFRELTVEAFVGRLASDQPVPGGGSAAAVAGSLAAALVAMVSALSKGREKYAQHADLHARVEPAGRALTDRFLALADEDAAAYAGFRTAMKLPRETAAEQESRAAAIRQAARAASQAPFRIVEACEQVVVLAETLAGRSNRSAASDLEVACLLAVAAARSAAANVYINLPAIGDETAARDLQSRTEALVDRVERLADRTREIVRSGDARDPVPAPGA
jgi:formiminotetrahydrofolate cyclodeaminase